jgi:hypothetical protein
MTLSFDSTETTLGLDAEDLEEMDVQLLSHARGYLRRSAVDFAGKMPAKTGGCTWILLAGKIMEHTNFQ